MTEVIRTIDALDALGRPRTVQVLVTDTGLVGLHVPAGESALIPPTRVQEVRDALADARVEAIPLYERAQRKGQER